jgi:hypothetical protein
MPYEEAYALVTGTVPQEKTDDVAVENDDSATTSPDDTTVAETEDVISGGYKSISSWAQQNISKGLSNGTISKDRAAEMLYAQILDTYKIEPHKKLNFNSALKQTPENIQLTENALTALWNTAYDLDIMEEMAELCEVSLSSVPAKYTGGRKKTTSSGTVSSKGTKSTASTAATKTAASNKDDGGILGWLKGFISDYNTR